MSAVARSFVLNKESMKPETDNGGKAEDNIKLIQGEDFEIEVYRVPCKDKVRV